MSSSKVVFIPSSVNRQDEAELRRLLPSSWHVARLDQAIQQAQAAAYMNSGQWVEDLLYLLHRPLR